jgi:hypothetical protein
MGRPLRHLRGPASELMQRRLVRLIFVSVLAVVLLGGGAAFTKSGTPHQPPPSPLVRGARADPIPHTTTAKRSAAPIPSSMKVVALGDSVTAGSRCDCVAFPQLYATGLESRYGVSIQLTNDGRGGQTSDDVLADLDSTSRAEADVAAADVVLVTIGANDFSQVHGAIVTNTCGMADRLSCARASAPCRSPVDVAGALRLVGCWNSAPWYPRS